VTVSKSPPVYLDWRTNIFQLIPRKQMKRAGAAVGMRTLGILLMVFGVFALAYGEIRYTTREKVLQVGSLQATTERHHALQLPPIVGIACIAGGFGLVLTTKTRG
jgi:hypothetical protein